MKFFSAVRHLAAVAAVALALVVPAHADAEVTPLVSTDWLRQHLKEPDLVVLDIRSAIDGGSAETYAQGHIPGAIHSDYDKAAWRVTRNGVPFMLPSAVELEKQIGETGIDEDSHVVVVPAGVHYTDFGSAARIYWTLKVAGLKKVSILDGGHSAWVAAKNEIETGVNKPQPKIFTATIDKSLLAEGAEVEALQRSGGATLIDARPPGFFSGKTRAPAAKAYGRIPGAVNVDSAIFYDDAANRLRRKDELEKLAAALPGGPAVAYCNTGHWAATDWFVLSELLGRKDVRVYPGSMVEWTSDPGRPLASSRTKWDDLKKALGFGS